MRKTAFVLFAGLLSWTCTAEPVCVNGVCYPDEAAARAAGVSEAKIAEARAAGAHDDAPGQGLSDLKSLIEGLSNGETACKLGVHVQEVTQEMAESRDLPPGLFVTDVIPGLPALAAGIQSGDILMRIGDSEIRTVQDLQAVLVDAEPGDETTVTVSRRGRDGYGEETFAVVLEPR